MFCLPHLPPYDTARTAELRVDKYSTVCIDNCHYSVPDRYVGEFIFAKIYPKHIKCYYDRRLMAEHEKKQGYREWSIQIQHYQKTLKKKPGALAGSLALKQAQPELKRIYYKHYTSKPKEFIQLIEIVGEKGWDKVKKAMESLEHISPNEISNEKIQVLCSRNKELEIPKNETATEVKSKDTLSSYDQLLNPNGNEFEEGAKIL